MTKDGRRSWEGRRFLLISLDTSKQWSIVSRVIFVAAQPGAQWTISLEKKNTLTRNHRRLLKRPVEWQTDVRPLNGYTGHLPLLLLICAFSLFSEETHFSYMSHYFILISRPRIKLWRRIYLVFFSQPLRIINEAKYVF